MLEELLYYSREDTSYDTVNISHRELELPLVAAWSAGIEVHHPSLHLGRITLRWAYDGQHTFTLDEAEGVVREFYRKHQRRMFNFNSRTEYARGAADYRFPLPTLNRLYLPGISTAEI